MKAWYLVVGYIVVIFVVGMMLLKKNKTIQDVFVAKNGLGVLALIPLVMSETIAGSGTVGATAEAMSRGMSVVWSSWGLGLGCLAFMLVFSKFYRILGDQKGIMSIPGAFGVVFDGRTKSVVMLMTCLIYTILFSLQPVATAAILSPMLNLDPRLVMIGSCVIFILIAMFGGLKGLAWTNIIHSFVMFFGLLLVVLVAFSRFGDISQLKLQLDPSYFSFAQPSLFAVLSIVVGLFLSQMGSSLMVNICLSAKNLKTARLGIGFGSSIIFIFALFPAILGLTAKANMPEIIPATALYQLSNELSPWLGGIAVMAVIAAIFSTAPALLLVVGTTLTEDFYGVIVPTTSEKSKLKFARFSFVLVGATAVVMSLNTSSIFSSMLGALQVRSIAAVVMLIALIWPRVNATAGFWSILIGSIVAVVWFALGKPLGLDPLIPSLLIGLGILVVITLRTKERKSEGYMRYELLKEQWNKANK